MTLHAAALKAFDDEPAEAEAMRPLVFDGQFGWLHQGVGPSSDTGVVLIQALGRDARCAHMPMRRLADQFAAQGFPTLRYDHAGTGDSLDLAEGVDDALPRWLAGIDQAIAALRATTGVRKVVLGGVRFGAAFAAVAASKADGVILLAPVLNGRSWLRRLRFSSGGPGGDDQPLDTDGLLLSGATSASLAGLDLAAAPPPAKAFVAAQNKMVETYAAGLAKAGAAVQAGDFPGFEALFLDAHSNLPPDQVFERATAWLKAEFGDPATGVASFTAPPPPASLRLDGAVERAIRFGPELQGVLCEPEVPLARAPAVLIINTGGDPRAGIGGFAASAARRLAAAGVASLRFDFAGLGDSPMADGAVRCHVYETPREAEMAAAISLLAERNSSGVVIVGVCAGAYHAMRTAWHDPRVTGFYAVSPVKLIWKPGDSLAFGRKDLGKATRVYTKAMVEADTWKRLLQGRIDLVTIARTLGPRLWRRVSGLFDRQADSPLAEMRAFARRGGRAHFLMGLDDASLDEIETYFGPQGSALTRAPNMSVQIVQDVDHGLARSVSRRIALDGLIAWLGLEGRSAKR